MPSKRTSSHRSRVMERVAHDNGALVSDSLATPPSTLSRKRTRSSSPSPIESVRRSKRTALAREITVPNTPSSLDSAASVAGSDSSSTSTSQGSDSQESPALEAGIRKQERFGQPSVLGAILRKGTVDLESPAGVDIVRPDVIDEDDLDITHAPTPMEDDARANEQLLREEREAWQRQENKCKAVDRFVKEKYRAIHKELNSFINGYFSFEVDNTKRKKLFKTFLNEVSPEFVRIAGQIADGGPDGKLGWQDLVLDGSSRPALVCGIVSKVLNDRVLTSRLFGGTEEQKGWLDDGNPGCAEENTSDAGETCCHFDRKHVFRCIASDEDWKTNLDEAVGDTAADIYLLLHPLLKMAPDFHYIDCQSPGMKILRTVFFQTHICPDQPHVGMMGALLEIVGVAAELNHKFRSVDHTTYYHPSITKGMEYDPKKHYCISNVCVETNSSSSASEDSELDSETSDGEPSNGLIKIVAMEGCSMIRNQSVESDSPEQVLVRGRVVIRWGQPRLHGVASEDDLRQRLKDWPQFGDVVNGRKFGFGLF